MVAYGLIRQMQTPGDVEVAPPVGDQVQNLDLPVG
jgi:hypothetical protein